MAAALRTAPAASITSTTGRPRSFASAALLPSPRPGTPSWARAVQRVALGVERAGMNRLTAEPGDRHRVEGHRRVQRQVGRRDREAAVLADDDELQRARRPDRLHLHLDDPTEA